MKKFKTLAKTFVLAALAVVSFASCSSDDDSDPKQEQTDQNGEQSSDSTTAKYKYMRGEFCFALSADEFEFYDLKAVYTKADGSQEEVKIDSTNTKKLTMKEVFKDSTENANDYVYVYTVEQKYETLPMTCKVQLKRTRNSKVAKANQPYELGAMVRYSIYAENAEKPLTDNIVLNNGYEGMIFDPAEVKEAKDINDVLTTLEEALILDATKEHVFNLTSAGLKD